MKSKIQIAFIIVLILLLVPLLYNLATSHDAEKMKIKEVLVTNDQMNVLVYVRLSHITTDTEKAILAGVRTKFTYKIEFYQDEEF